MKLAAVPGIAQLVRGHRDRREGRGRLRLEEAKTLGEFGRDQAAQRDVVDEHDKADRARASSPMAPIGTSPTTTAISPSMSTPQASSAIDDRIARPEEAVGAALVHQRIGPEAMPASRHLRALRTSST